MTVGGFLAAKRGERGLSLQQAAAATHIRLEHLSALEADEPELLPAPVYARGYLRTYARYLGLDAESLVVRLDHAPLDPRKMLGLGMLVPRPRLVLTGPAAAVAGPPLPAGALSTHALRPTASEPHTPIFPPPPN